jgi:hypothetical protein
MLQKHLCFSSFQTLSLSNSNSIVFGLNSFSTALSSAACAISPPIASPLLRLVHPTDLCSPFSISRQWPARQFVTASQMEFSSNSHNCSISHHSGYLLTMTAFADNRIQHHAMLESNAPPQSNTQHHAPPPEDPPSPPPRLLHNHPRCVLVENTSSYARRNGGGARIGGTQPGGARRRCRRRTQGLAKARPWPSPPLPRRRGWWSNRRKRLWGWGRRRGRRRTRQRTKMGSGRDARPGLACRKAGRPAVRSTTSRRRPAALPAIAIEVAAMPTRRLAPRRPGAALRRTARCPTSLAARGEIMGKVLGMKLGIGGRGGVWYCRRGGRRRTGGGTDHDQGSI